LKVLDLNLGRATQRRYFVDARFFFSSHKGNIMRIFPAIAAVLLCLSNAAFAGEPRFGQTAFSLQNGTSAQTVFAPDAPTIVLHAEVQDMPKGAKIAADWIAVKTDVAPANYKIDSAAIEIDKDIASDEASFSLSRPNAGWPVGDYRVDLSINGKVAKSAPFKVAK
jgi:hypothetical protein